MSEQEGTREDSRFVRNALAAAIQIGIIFLLAMWSFKILSPFISLVAWAAIIAIAIYPLHLKLADKLGGKAKISAVLIAIVMLLVLITPAWIALDSSISSVKTISEQIETGTLKIAPPNESVAEWPVVGKRVYDVWSSAATNLEATARELEPQLKSFGKWLASSITGAIFGVVAFIISILIAAALLLNADGIYKAFRTIGYRLAGETGASFTDLSVATVRSVTKGVLGVAFIQAILAFLGMLVIGVPGAGLIAAVALIFAIAQLPLLLIMVPVGIYVYSVEPAVPATIFMVYAVVVSVSDAALKPMLLGRGLEVPTLVILLGAIGGMIVYGIIGLFIGAIILALGYELLVAWMKAQGESSDSNADIQTKGSLENSE